MDANLFVKVTVISAVRHQVCRCSCCTIRSETCASVSQDSCVWNLHFGESFFSFFGHFSHRSEWQLIKIDYKGLFSRRCMDGDYQTWQLHNKVTAILKISDLLWTSGDTCLSVVTVNKVHFVMWKNLINFLFLWQGELCVMGEKQIFMKRRPGNRCMLVQGYSRIFSSEPCLCTTYDFEW